jgi:hypothetical protein
MTLVLDGRLQVKIRNLLLSRAAGGALLLALVIGVTACGSSSSSGASTSGAQGAGPRGGFAQNPQVVACLKKQGITPPNRRPGAAPQSGGQPQGRPPGQRNSAQFQKFRAALQKCGVTPPGGGAPGQPPASGGSSN